MRLATVPDDKREQYIRSQIDLILVKFGGHFGALRGCGWVGGRLEGWRRVRAL